MSMRSRRGSSLLAAATAVCGAIQSGASLQLAGNATVVERAKEIADGVFGRQSGVVAEAACWQVHSIDQVAGRDTSRVPSEFHVTFCDRSFVEAAATLGDKDSTGDIGLLICSKDVGDLLPLANAITVSGPLPDKPIIGWELAVWHLICDLSVSDRSIAPDRNPALPEGKDDHKITELSRLVSLREEWRDVGRTIVWSNGCFDLLHEGHVRSLKAARDLGDIHIVGINSDASIAALKGPQRPIMPASARAEILGAMSSVDFVIVFDELTPETAISVLQPDVHCKGADYAPPHGKPVPEARIVEAYGGRVAFLPLVPFRSTTSIIERILSGDGG